MFENFENFDKFKTNLLVYKQSILLIYVSITDQCIHMSVMTAWLLLFRLHVVTMAYVYNDNVTATVYIACSYHGIC